MSDGMTMAEALFCVWTLTKPGDEVIIERDGDTLRADISRVECPPVSFSLANLQAGSTVEIQRDPG